MSTISEALKTLEPADEYQSSRPALAVVDRLRNEFLTQEKLADSDRRLAPTLFDLMSACLQQQADPLSKDKGAVSEPIAQHERISSAAKALARVQLALAVTLVFSIVIDTTALSLLLALSIGLICYLVASGRWEDLGKTAAVSWLLRFVGPSETPKAPDSLATEEA